jgi:DedD protein
VRARRRLIGAVVLVAAGVIGFPLLFETQPRPIPIDIPIEIPRKDGTPTLNLPQAPAAVVLDAADVPDTAKPADKSSTAVAAADGAAPEKGASGQVITEGAEDAGREVPAPKAASAAKTMAAAASKPAAAKPPASHPAATKVADATKPGAAEAARAKALLEGKQAAQDKAKDRAKDSKDGADDKGRFVIQVGAFADSAAAHAVRLKVERLGMKTYTQVAQTADGPRIRVRVGPFGTRGDAEKAQSKAKSAGLPASLLTL